MHLYRPGRCLYRPGFRLCAKIFELREEILCLYREIFGLYKEMFGPCGSECFCKLPSSVVCRELVLSCGGV